MVETKNREENKTLGLDDIEANALYAYQHNLLFLFRLPEYSDLKEAFRSVKEKQRKIGMTDPELKKVPIDESWISFDLIKRAKAADKIIERNRWQANLWKILRKDK